MRLLFLWAPACPPANKRGWPRKSPDLLLSPWDFSSVLTVLLSPHLEVLGCSMILPAGGQLPEGPEDSWPRGSWVGIGIARVTGRETKEQRESERQGVVGRDQKLKAERMPRSQSHRDRQQKMYGLWGPGRHLGFLASLEEAALRPQTLLVLPFNPYLPRSLRQEAAPPFPPHPDLPHTFLTSPSPHGFTLGDP